MRKTKPLEPTHRLQYENPSPEKQDRRSFLRRAGALLLGLPLGSATFAGAARAVAAENGATEQLAGHAKSSSVASANERIKHAYELRQAAARIDSELPITTPIAIGKNGDAEGTRSNPLFAEYSKALPHDELGHVNKLAYQTYLAALASGKPADFEKIPLGGNLTLSNPIAAYSYNLDGCDSSQIPIAPPPSFSSAETAAEIIELYWMALLRDVPFSDYESSEEIKEAGSDLGKHLSGYADKKETNGTVSPALLFREGSAQGSTVGPYLSQFLWLDVPYGATKIVQKYRFPIPREDFLTGYPEWLRTQRGFLPTDALRLDSTPRYVRTGRDLAEYVHRDFTYQSFLNAALILFGAAYSKHEPRVPFSRENPYVDSLTQTGFSTFGGPHVLEMIPRAASVALRASWYQKWLVFRKLRPEALAGRIHNQLQKKSNYPLHKEILGSSVLQKTRASHESWLLPQAYPEGAPTHPAFPAGHAVIAGACATIIKAFFDEDYELPHPVLPTADGLSLEPYKGKVKLTVGNEISKFATNIAVGRSFAGIHWRSDSREGLRVGEASAISVLKNWRNTTQEGMDTHFRFTGFSGNEISI